MIGYVLPAALGVALSPIPIIAVVMILGGARPRARGSLFALGWVIGLSAICALAAVLFDGAESDGSTPSTAASIVRLAAGALLWFLAVRQWQKRPKRGDSAEIPAWMVSIETVTPMKAAGLGAALSGANPKNLALTLTAAASVAEAGLDDISTTAAIGAFVLLGSSSVLGPVLFHLIDPRRAATHLAAVRQFMAEHSAVIAVVILILLGASLVGDGLEGVF